MFCSFLCVLYLVLSLEMRRFLKESENMLSGLFFFRQPVPLNLEMFLVPIVKGHVCAVSFFFLHFTTLCCILEFYQGLFAWVNDNSFF